MLKGIISSALTEQEFSLVHESEQSSYFLRLRGEAARFAIVHEMTELQSPESLNEAASFSAPKEFVEHPAFKKNCDLICLLRLEKLAEFKELEDRIFAIEEDAYHYKKYVLYYTKEEEDRLAGFEFADLLRTISDKSQFDSYKNSPLSSSTYSIAAKIFIKIPFLILSHEKRELVPLKLQAEAAVAESELTALYKKVQNLPEIDDIATDDLVKELIKNELENIPN
ncbi:ABC-three component system middle component 1 [Pseudomonas aeruginosa]|uniref:ABC-three component system middle component 1 n=1 Tax=Pseudomonas aeruginosa TaxID=287 RepID=UPI001E60022C|nr:ABC-three component system middle component 1 [Pseudomonas aeruginosa]